MDSPGDVNWISGIHKNMKLTRTNLFMQIYGPLLLIKRGLCNIVAVYGRLWIWVARY